MALFSKSLEAAQQTTAKAEAAVREWEAKAAATRSEAAELEAQSGAQILEDPSQAEKISIRISSLERTARAYDGAVAEAVRKLTAARRAAFEVEASDEDKLAGDAAKRLEAHSRKVSALLAQLKEVNGANYVPARLINEITGLETVDQEPTRTGQLSREATTHSVRAATIRYFLATSQIPTSFYELNAELGTQLGASAFTPAEFGIPASVLAARDAEIELGAVGA